MPFNGQGVFTPKHNWTNEANSGTPILPDRMDDQANDMATGLSSAILRDGTGSPTADIPWAGFSITGLRAPQLGGDVANKAYVDTATGARSMGGFKLTNVAAPTAGGDTVNLTYLQQFALNAALPNQAGNSDRIPTTDGANASWTNALKATVIRFKDGADATKLLAFDLSGLTTATTCTLAAPNKSGTLATLSDLALTLLATITPTAAATVDFLNTFSATYDNYLIIGDGLSIGSGTAGTTDYLVARYANAGAVDSGSSYVDQIPAGSQASTASAQFRITNSVVNGGKGASFAIHILNANDASNQKMAKSVGSSQAASGNPGGWISFDYYSAYIGGAVSGFRLFWNSGNTFAAQGKIRVYGYQNA